MASNFISRFAGSSNASASIYETLRQYDEDTDGSDVEERAGLAAGLRAARDGFHDLGESHMNMHTDRANSRHIETHGDGSRVMGKDKHRVSQRPRWSSRPDRLLEVEEVDDDVPASLLIDHNAEGREHDSMSLPPPPSQMSDGLPSPGDLGFLNSGRNQRSRSQGEPNQGVPRSMPFNPSFWSNLANADPKERAMFRWVNVTNLDNFLLDVYNYYLCHGFWSILLMRFLNLITVAFVIGFSLFLTQCIDYQEIKGSTKMSEILIPQCASKMGFIPNALLWITSFVWVWNLVLYFFDIFRLRQMHDFYLYLLGVPEAEIQSISWQEIVSRLMALRDSNPTITSTFKKSTGFIRSQNKQRMDAHDIASRLMRRENYMIAMINKDLLDLTLPIPFLRHRKLFTRTLEWNLELCIMDFVFNDKGQVRPLFLKDTHRKSLSEALRNRFIAMGIVNLIFSPFLAVFAITKHFFQNFNEYQKNPAQIGSREYTRFAQWKFREFNELYHLFQRRINMSYPFATRYINQFPKDKTVQAAKFVSLVSGAVVSVLGLATVLDQENFLNFEVTPGRTTIFYIGIFGSIWAVARGLLPDDNMVYDTAFSVQKVIDFTHYVPAHWEGRLHTVEVKDEFSELYQMKVVIFFEEVLSMIFTPFVLWFSLPKCSERIIDFFREFTVHVDGIGYVCSFAEFGFMERAIRPQAAQATSKPAATGAATQAGKDTANAKETLRDDYFASKDNKLEQSYWGFMNDYARNPKTDVRFPYSNPRRRFNMPPPVPGLPSPSFPTADYGSTFGGIGHNNRQGAGLGILSPPQLGATSTPRFGPQHHSHGQSQVQPQPLGSPLQSLLLDPHHQPSASGFAVSPQTLRARGSVVHKPRHRDRDNIPDDVAEESSTGFGAHVDQHAQSQSNDLVSAVAAEPLSLGTTHEGELGSWKYDAESSDGGGSEDDGDEDDAKAITALGALGPLGLIRQFQKAQAQEGQRTRGAGAGI
ncbi:autophagy protein Apg9-domain-containing protein [Exophiala viscosa]|uniref:Autophagy-related protein 9 n=1 Tax=Exophiala viscosa TaxID=2486360 RepID=A0AAN6DWD5_9EURO|nr:autophagy protein Apg9-domain-containing protein [Exophiala viscosa]